MSSCFIRAFDACSFQLSAAVVEPREPERDASPRTWTQPQIRRVLEQRFHDVAVTATEQRMVEIAQRAAGHGGQKNVVVASRVRSRLEKTSYYRGITRADRHQQRLHAVDREFGIRPGAEQQLDRPQLPLVNRVEERRPTIAARIDDVRADARREQTLHGGEVARAGGDRQRGESRRRGRQATGRERGNEKSSDARHGRRVNDDFAM
jgi:hypothetical protein